MRRLARLFAAGSVASLLLLLGSMSISASVAIAGAHAVDAAAPNVDDFTFDHVSVDYTLTRAEDGTSRLEVVEEFVALFPSFDQNRGMRRSIPDSYNGQPLRPHLVSITDAGGTPRPAEAESDGGAFSMTSRSDAYLHGAQTFVFTYTLENVTWTFPDTGQEFYWDVNGVDWAQPFGQVTARLHVGADLVDELAGRQACYAGAHGARDACDLIESEDAADGGVVITASANEIGPHETLTMAVGFADDTFAKFDASFASSAWSWLQSAAAALCAVVAGIAVWVRRRFLRDEPGHPTVVAQYTPPATIDALESAVLLGRSTRGIPAEVLEQAVVGSIRIVEGGRKVFGGAKLTAELVDPSLADDNGAMLLRALFPGGEPGARFEFGKQDTRVSTVAQRVLRDADKELVRLRMRREVPAAVRFWPIAGAVVAAAAVVAFGIVALDSGVQSVVPWVLIPLAVAVAVFVVVMVSARPLTAVGAQTRDHLLGLKQFIEWAEADRIRMLQSPSGAERVRVDVDDPREMLHLYESLLPYAVVFGQEKQWSAQLATLYSQSGVAGPVWYAGTGTFDGSSFASGIGSLSTAAASSSSTSGGSSGGGSAGGGGGGGGGGGV